MRVPYAVLPEREFGTLGSALIAAASVNDITDLDKRVLEINKTVEILEPNEKNAQLYDHYFKDYEETIDGLIHIFNQREKTAASNIV